MNESKFGSGASKEHTNFAHFSLTLCVHVSSLKDRFIVEVNNAQYTTLSVAATILKSTLACYFRYFQKAIEMCEEYEGIGKVVQFSYGRMSWAHVLSFAHFEQYRATRKRKHLRKARRYKSLLVKLASEGSPDAATLVVFVSAVEMTLRKNIDKQQLVNVFETAASHLTEKGNYRLLGLLNEQAGFDFARRGHLKEARVHYDQALEIYQNQWCSNAKYEWLLEHTAKYTAPAQEPLSQGINMQIGNVIVYRKDEQLPATPEEAIVA